MGEVYRADDLRLGQPVALKLLPAALAQDAARLAQFHNEVRTARQVSHSNVCRVYDIGETDGQLFLTMEYVDGEDLAISLRRIGRFSEDKALDLARQLCAGLAAAHERGVLHRDLKPANIMLDRAGKVRIMDFGLAAAGQVDNIRVGTPAYMAPEQLSGTAVSVRSDIYALGLVIYELFTGRRAFEATSLAGLVNLHAAGAIVAPTDLVRGLDPRIERAILRCLDPDPARRPRSALAMSASLPSGDPLAAALAAGETPSPEMVAAAGSGAPGLSPVLRATFVSVCVVLLVGVALVSDRVILVARTRFDRAPSTLFDRARDLEHRLGYAGPTADRAFGFTTQSEVWTWVLRNRSAPDQARALAAARPPVLVFWYRSSPTWLVPDGNAVGPGDPPGTQADMTTIVLDTEGRLIKLQRVPPQVGPDPADPRPTTVDWSVLFESAGLDLSRFTPTTVPVLTPRVYADARAAWIGTVPEWPDTPLHVEAGFYLGHPVFFEILGPWNIPASGQTPEAGSHATALVSLIATVLVVPGMLLAGGVAARANLRRGRGDRKGATRLAAAVFILEMGGWLFMAHHVPDAGVEQARFFKAAALALFNASVIGIFYLAAEPQVRRVWPHILITWSRLLGGSVRDPMVGRDVLIGATCGLVMTVVSYVFYLVPGWMGWPAFEPHTPGLDTLIGTRYVIAECCLRISYALQNAMLGVLGLALLRPLLRREWLTFAVAVALFAPLGARGQFQSGILALDVAFGAMLVIIILGVLFRFGLFAGIVGFFVHFWTFSVALTADPERQYFQTGLVAMGVVLALAVAGATIARKQT